MPAATAAKGGPSLLGVAVGGLEKLALGAGDCKARDRRGLASTRVSPLLDLDLPAKAPGSTGSQPRDLRFKNIPRSLSLLAQEREPASICIWRSTTRICNHSRA